MLNVQDWKLKKFVYCSNPYYRVSCMIYNPVVIERFLLITVQCFQMLILNLIAQTFKISDFKQTSTVAYERS